MPKTKNKDVPRITRNKEGMEWERGKGPTAQLKINDWCFWNHFMNRSNFRNETDSNKYKLQFNKNYILMLAGTEKGRILQTEYILTWIQKQKLHLYNLNLNTEILQNLTWNAGMLHELA